MPSARHSSWRSSRGFICEACLLLHPDQTFEVIYTLAGFKKALIRDGPNTTTIIFQKSFASDAASKRHLMAHQMKNLCVFSVFHCVEGAFGAASGGTPKMKNGAPQNELKNGRGRGWAVCLFKGRFLQKHLNLIQVPFLGNSVRILGVRPTVIPIVGL